jgi:membrane fusion protein, multidrug efflux system
MTTRSTAIVVVGLLAVVAGAAAYWYWTAPPAQQTTVTSKAGFRKKGFGANSTDQVPVLAIDARTADVPVYLDGVGTARATNTVTVRAQVEGKLIAVLFQEGQDVTKGFLLAKIDPTTYQAQYDQTVAKKAQDEATLANARLDLERYIRLAATNAVNKQQVDTTRALVNQLEAQVRSDQASIDNAKAILAYTDILAPIGGRTGLRLVDEGNIVRALDTTGIVMITQMKPITVLFNLPQQDLPDINRGLNEGPLPIDAIAPDGKTTADKGKVLVVDNQVDQTTGTVRLKAEFPNDNLQLWPGQFVNVRLLIDTLRQVVVVPTAAVQRGPNGTFVYVVKDDMTVTVRPITVSQQDDLQAVIARGLSAGEHVVTTGFARLAEGTLVVVTNAEEAGQLNTTRPERPRGGRGQKGNDKGGNDKAGSDKGNNGKGGGQKKGAAPVAGAAPATTGSTTGAAP